MRVECHILLVEDDDATREATSALLHEQGYRVTAAADGQEALAQLRGGLRPNLIILDLLLPGMDGWAFRAEQLADPGLAPIPVLVCSAAGDLPGRAGLLRAAALLSKPVEFTHLARVVRSLAGPGVLVVDDEPHIRRVLELALTREGLAVWTAASGREAVELYRRQRDSIGVVLLDVNMPGLSGPCTLAELRQINPAVRAAFVTGGASEVDELLALGAAAVLPKPFDLTGLTRTVERLLVG